MPTKNLNRAKLQELENLRIKFIVPASIETLCNRMRSFLDKGIRVVVDNKELVDVVLPRGLHDKDKWATDAIVLYGDVLGMGIRRKDAKVLWREICFGKKIRKEMVISQEEYNKAKAKRGDFDDAD